MNLTTVTIVALLDHAVGTLLALWVGRHFASRKCTREQRCSTHRDMLIVRGSALLIMWIAWVIFLGVATASGNSMFHAHVGTFIWCLIGAALIALVVEQGTELVMR